MVVCGLEGGSPSDFDFKASLKSDLLPFGKLAEFRSGGFNHALAQLVKVIFVIIQFYVKFHI